MNAVNEVEKRVMEEEMSGGDSSMDGRNGWCGSIATIDVSDRRSLDVETGMAEIAVHPIALHAIDSIPVTGNENTSSNTDIDKDMRISRLMAYGGASGLLRIHSINILKEIVGIES